MALLTGSVSGVNSFNPAAGESTDAVSGSVDRGSVSGVNSVNPAAGESTDAVSGCQRLRP